jgi:hypothetical protein
MDQDTIQKLNSGVSVVLELYRVLVSSFLILFVPQSCGDHVCSYSENLTLENQLYSSGLVFNFATMAAFVLLYGIEIKRENRLITYLEVNKSKPCDNDSVEVALNNLSLERRTNIWLLDKRYQQASYLAFTLFMVNTILSGVVVYEYYLDGQTTTTFITNILFMLTKLNDVYTNVNTEQNVFYSAYLKGKVQYNDVDPDKVEPNDIGIEVPLEVSSEENVTEKDIELNC